MKQAIGCVIIFCICATAYAGEWHVDTRSENLVRFTSEVIVLTFDGVTDQIDGYLYWEGDAVFGKNNQLHFEVTLNALDTGIGKRDRDMRDVLETDKWPLTTFTGTIADFKIVDTTLTTYQVTTTGTFSVHGKQKQLTLPGTISLPSADRMHIQSDFTIRLSDYDIEAPSLAAFVKVSDEVVVHLDFYLIPATK